MQDPLLLGPAVPGGPLHGPPFSPLLSTPKERRQGGLALSSAGAMAPARWSLPLGKGDPYLPLEATSTFHCLSAGAVRAAGPISQGQGVKGPPASHQARPPPRLCTRLGVQAVAPL